VRDRLTMVPRTRPLFGAFSLLGAFLLAIAFAVAPPTPEVDVSATENPAFLGQQKFAVPGSVVAGNVTRDGYGFTPGSESYIEGGTNHDWAKLVLFYAGWPVSDSNVAVMTRWMRQENGPDDWWNRNNPLNNGYGSGGGSGLGSYDTLATAAAMAAENLQNYSGYGPIRSGFARSAPPAEIEAAIWASPWATSHYGNGSHWAYTPVPVIEAPASAWGR
jgi:hypothetical protein